MPKVLRDGVLVDVDDNGNDVLVKPPVDGPLANSTTNPVGLIGPLEGKNNDGVSADVLRKIETEGRAAADRDMPEARNLAHPGVNEPRDADRSVVREDGTVTTQHHPELTATYLHGSKVLISDAQRAKYDSMLDEMNKLMGDTAVGDIPVDDPYWAKKKELDAFVARLKR